MATLSALVSGLETELQRLGYKDSTLVWYRGCWRRLARFFAARGVEEFSLDLAMAWVDTPAAGSSRRSRRARSSRRMSTCSGLRRCWAILSGTGRFCAATTDR
jgi:hypothetical protein